MTELDVTHHAEDDDPEHLVGEDVDDLPADRFPPGARFTDEEWAVLQAVRGT